MIYFHHTTTCVCARTHSHIHSMIINLKNIDNESNSEQFAMNQYLATKFLQNLDVSLNGKMQIT